MKRLVIICAAASLLAACGGKTTPEAAPAPEAKFSTFSDHIFSVAHADSTSLYEAACWVKAQGIDGIDARTSLSAADMAAFDSAGLAHACAILDVSHELRDIAPLEDEALAFCQTYGFDKLMYCPRLLTDDATEAHTDSVYASLLAFTQRAAEQGVEVSFEDYDNPRSLTFNREKLDVMFDRVPQAKHTFDTGNFCYASDSVMPTFDHFRSRINHVHLKDRKAMADGQSLTIGTGIACCKQVMDSLLAQGYDGWFCIEGYGVTDMKQHLTQSVANLRK